MFEAKFQSFADSAAPALGTQHLKLLRAELERRGLDGFLVPRADAHQNEYVPPCDERLAWLTGFTGSAGVAIVQFFPDYSMIGLVLGIFVFGQFIEGYILSPKLVGDSVGLHPVWLMFALLAFGYMLGFLGLLLAVPLAAAAGVLVRFAIGQYLESPLYTGEEEHAATAQPAALPAVTAKGVR